MGTVWSLNVFGILILYVCMVFPCGSVCGPASQVPTVSAHTANGRPQARQAEFGPSLLEPQGLVSLGSLPLGLVSLEEPPWSLPGSVERAAA